jgi:lipopolysaccharide export system protein LptA
MKKFIFIIFIFIGFSGALISQSYAGINEVLNQDRVRIENADSMVNIVKENNEIVELWGNVRMIQGEAFLNCDSARWWRTADRVLLMGLVNIYDGKRTLEADRVDYSGTDRIEKARGNVILKTKNKEFYSDELTYSQEDEFASAMGHIRIVDLLENVILQGQIGSYDRISDYSRIEENAVLVMIDSVSNDTMTVKGLTMEAWGEDQRFLTTGSVLIEKRDMRAICQRALYDSGCEKLFLRESPVVWQKEQRMSGDSIDVQLEGVNFSGGLIQGRGEVLSIDSTKEDLLKGQIIEMIASGDTLRKIIVSHQASSIYHIIDQETGEEGVNSVNGDKIVMDFKKGELARVKVTSLPGQSSGIYKPVEENGIPPSKKLSNEARRKD